MKTVTAVVIGAGERGMGVYAPYALVHPDALRIVAVAEPVQAKRDLFQQRYGLADSACYVGYKEFFENPVAADCVFVCTQDRMHVEPALLALAKGYHVLLEKPMAPTEEDCRRLAAAAHAAGRYLMVCHVLRYTPFYAAVKALLQSGAIGRLMTVQHCESIAYWHFAHSFVRGNWGVAADSAPMILAKCCHDLDLLQWLVGTRCTSVQSDGALSYFCAENAPQGAPLRCMDGCPHAHACSYYAPDLYLGQRTEWPVSAISVDTSLDARREAIRTGPYGRCVFHCDNDVCDHQSVQLRFEGDVTVNLTATAFGAQINRKTIFTGTKGEVEASFDEARMLVRYFGTGRQEDIRLNVGIDTLGHGGGDWRLLSDFVALVGEGRGEAKTLADDSLVSHVLAFAAEKSRASGEVVHL